MLHDHTNPCSPDSIGLTKHLGNIVFLWLTFTTLDQLIYGVSSTTYHAAPTIYMHHFISGTPNIPHSLLNSQQITSPLHMFIYI
jgi:hypothetical protein